MKKINQSIVIILSFFSLTLSSQNYKWVKSVGAGSAEEFNQVATDAQKNTINVGKTVSAVLVVGTTTLNNNGAEDILVVKTDFYGNVLWAKIFGSTGTDFGSSIAADNSGNTYICGSFSGTMVTGSSTLVSNGLSDIFVLKLDAGGNVLNAASYGGTGNDGAGDLALTPSGEIVVAAYFNSSISLGAFNLVSAGGSDILYFKLNPSFGVVWANSNGASLDDKCLTICTATNGDIFAAGQYKCSFPSVLNVPFPINCSGGNTLVGFGLGGSEETWLAKIDGTTGCYVWVKSIYGGSSEIPCGISADPSGNNCYVTGVFANNAFFDGTQYNSNGNQDGFFCKLSGSSGSFLFVKSIGGSGNDQCQKIKYTNKGLIFTGCFEGSTNFGNGYVMSPDSIQDVYVANYDETGQCKWVVKAGGKAVDRGYGLTVNNNKHIFFNGINVSTTFSCANLPPLSQAGAGDAFVARIDLLPDTAAICMVTVDSLSTHNIVYWDKTLVDTSVIDSFIIYRASPLFVQIGSKSKLDSSLFRDLIFPTNQSPNNIAHAYKIGTKDAFENYSTISNQLYHKVCFLTVQFNGTNKILSWNNYSDNNKPGYVTSYNIYKKQNGIGAWTALATNISAVGPSITYNDPATLADSLTMYYIEMNLTSPCNYGAKGADVETNKTRTKSNQSNERVYIPPSGFSKSTISTDNFKIYPNPANEKLLIISNTAFENLDLEVLDVSGRIIVRENNVKLNYELNTSLLNNGFCLIKIYQESRLIKTQKILVQH